MFSREVQFSKVDVPIVVTVLGIIIFSLLFPPLYPRVFLTVKAQNRQAGGFSPQDQPFPGLRISGGRG